MNRKQRACLTLGFLLWVVSALLPPWQSSIGRGTRFAYSSSSYGFLFTHSGGTLELSRLFVEWTLIVMVTVGLFFLFKGPIHLKHEAKTDSVTVRVGTWRRLFSLSIVLYVVIAALGITSFGLLRKVRRLEAGIQHLNASVAELPPPCTQVATLTPQEVLQADSQYHYTSDVWAAWVVVERQNLNACAGHIRRVREELSKLD